MRGTWDWTARLRAHCGGRLVGPNPGLRIGQSAVRAHGGERRWSQPGLGSDSASSRARRGERWWVPARSEDWPARLRALIGGEHLGAELLDQLHSEALPRKHIRLAVKANVSASTSDIGGRRAREGALPNPSPGLCPGKTECTPVLRPRRRPQERNRHGDNHTIRARRRASQSWNLGTIRHPAATGARCLRPRPPSRAAVFPTPRRMSFCGDVPPAVRCIEPRPERERG